HGNELLARLPIVPGLEPTVRAAIPDDDQRLAAEAIITGLQENFVDLVARRAVLINRIRTRMQAGKIEETKEVMVEVRPLGSQQEFSLLVRQQKQKLASKDPVMQRKINKLFDDTQQVVDRYLTENEIEQLDLELRTALRGQTASTSTGS